MENKFRVFQQNDQIIQQTWQLIVPIYDMLEKHLDKRDPDNEMMLSITQQFEAMLEKIPDPECYLPPKYDYFFNHMGQIYMQQNQNEKAVGCFNRALTLAPGNLKYIEYRRWSYEGYGDNQKAKGDQKLRKVLRQIADLAFQYKSTKLTRQRKKRMSHEISAILAETPDAIFHLSDKFVLTTLGQFFANRGLHIEPKQAEYEQAIFFFTRIINHSLDGFIKDYPCHTIDALRSRAWCLKQINHLDAAREDEAEIKRLIAYQGIPWQQIVDTVATNQFVEPSYEENDELLDISQDKMNNDLGTVRALKIGEGGFGTVIKTTFQQQVVAVKIMHPTNNPLSYWHFNNEIAIHSKLSHRHILPYIGHHRTPQENGNMALMTPLMRCSLTALLEDLNSPLAWDIRLRMAVELLEAVTYIHKNNMLHRDLKTDNILLDENNQIKVADFGSALDQSDTSFYRYLLQDSEVGSWAYWAPEIFKNKDYTEASDIWAVSLILCQISSRAKPYQTCEDKKQLEEQLLQEQHNPFATDTPEAFKALTTRGWSLNAAHRPTAEIMTEELKEIAFINASM